MAAEIDDSSEQSAGRTRAPTARPISAAIASSPSRRRAIRATLAPSRASLVAVARPMPLLAPVTTARLPANRSEVDDITIAPPHRDVPAEDGPVITGRSRAVL